MSSDEFDLNAALSDETTPAGLRDWAKTVQKQNKTLADELTTFKTQARSNTLTSALRDAGVSEKLARFYPGDRDVAGEQIASWLKENADVFGVEAKPTAGEAQTTSTDHNPQVADIAAMQAVQKATPTTSTTESLADKVQKIDGLKMKTIEDRTALDDFERSLMEMARADPSNSYTANAWR